MGAYNSLQETEHSGDGAAPVERPTAEHGWTGQALTIYNSSTEACRESPAELSNTVADAQLYARSWKPEFRQAAFEGCLVGKGVISP